MRLRLFRLKNIIRIAEGWNTLVKDGLIVVEISNNAREGKAREVLVSEANNETLK